MFSSTRRQTLLSSLEGAGNGGGDFGGLSLQSLEGLVAGAANWALMAFGVMVTVADNGGESSGTVVDTGIGVDISYNGGTIDLQNVSLDVKTGMIDAKVIVDGQSEGDVGLLQLGADGTIGLTAATADVVDMIVGHDVVSANTTINLGQLLSGFGFHGGGGCGHHSSPPSGGSTAIAGGETLVVLPGGPALQSHGVTITALGSANLHSFAGLSGCFCRSPAARRHRPATPPGTRAAASSSPTRAVRSSSRTSSSTTRRASSRPT